MAKRPLIHKKRLDSLSDDDLLKLRFCDFKLNIQGTTLEERIAQLYDELAAKGLRFRPHCWLSDDWYSPDGVPGIAIPFYLAHRRLARLERAQMFEVEGGTHEWCMRLLRHEAGHAIDTAYRLRRRRAYREHFGRVSLPYPNSYQPNPSSRDFVQNLGGWYAQAHPVEDFAETFAVWLRPRSGWRAKYCDWPALEKLAYVDDLMQDIAERKPIVATRQQTDALPTLRKTLGQHYRRKRAQYGLHQEETGNDHELLRVFNGSTNRRQPLAATFLHRNRRELCRAVAKRTGQYQYTVDQVLNEMILRCRELQLRLQASESASRQRTLGLLARRTKNYVKSGFHRVAM